MRIRKLVLVLAAVLPAMTFYLAQGAVTIIEFEARGHFGDETIRLTANKDSLRLLDETRVGKEWKTYRVKTIWPVHDVRLYYLNRPKPIDPPRLLYIYQGIVKLYRKDIFGNVLVRKDILNINSAYLGLDGKELFAEDSTPMGSVRGGITGWTGYYELYL